MQYHSRTIKQLPVLRIVWRRSTQFALFFVLGYFLLPSLSNGQSPKARRGALSFSSNIRILTPDILKKIYRTPEDKLTKKACTGRARVTIHCRDKLHYVTSNEYNHQLFYPYIKDIGGGHIGVGVEQNFTIIAWARSEFAWLTDYDPVVVRVNLAHRAIIIASPDRKTFVNYWKRKAKNMKRAIRLLRTFYKSHPERRRIIQAYRYAVRKVARNYRYILWRKRRYKNRPDFHWLHRKETFLYIRKMFKEGHIRVMKTDLLLNKGLVGIGKISHEVKIPIRTLYLSNAESFWRYTPQFRKNICGLLMDKKSTVLRTHWTKRFGPKYSKRWSYAAQGGLHFQEKLKNPRYRHVYSMMKHRRLIERGRYEIHTLIKLKAKIKKQRRRRKRLKR